VTGTRHSDRPATGLYLICGRGQPVGIIALLVAHNISMPPACRPPEPRRQSPRTGRGGTATDRCHDAVPLPAAAILPLHAVRAGEPGGAKALDKIDPVAAQGAEVMDHLFR